MSWNDLRKGRYSLSNNETSLAEVVKDIKGRSAFVLNKRFHLQGKCWQSAYYDRALRRDQDRRAVARYIIANPLRANLVSSLTVGLKPDLQMK